MTDTTLTTAVEAGSKPILLQDGANFEAAERCWNAVSMVGLDTEFVRERTYKADLGLVQISDGETAWLVDPLVTESHQPLQRLLNNPAVVKILHSSSEDLEVLLLSLGALPKPMVDTQVACAMLGHPLQLGYHHAVKELFDIEVDKDQTRSNWIKRPLTEKQLHYAAMDVVLLPEMWRLLREKLCSLDRLQWLDEEVERMQKNAHATVDPELAYLRIGGIARLDDTALRVIRQLAAWRERTAVERNRARGFVIRDNALMQIARDQPQTTAQIRQTEDIHPNALRRFEDQLLEQVETGRQDSSPIQRPRQMDGAHRKKMKAMRAVVLEKAAELNVDPALLASRKQLETLLWANEDGDEVPERFTGWRKPVLLGQLLDTLRDS